jgi:hypothetical protein
LVALDPQEQHTILTWSQYNDAEDLDMNKVIFDQALANIAENLIRRFGGRVVVR